MEDKIIFKAHHLLSDFAIFDDFLWALDVPLNHVCLNSKEGNYTLFPANFSIKDWHFFHKVTKPKDINYLESTQFLVRYLPIEYPEFEKEIDALFYNPDGFCEIKDDRLIINYQKSYEALDFILRVKNHSFKLLHDFLNQNEKEIKKCAKESYEDESFYNDLVKYAKANELFIRVAIMCDALYLIFDENETDVERSIKIFNDNNQFIFNKKVDKFSGFYDSFKEIIEKYQNNRQLDANAFVILFKKLVEYRRVLFEKDCKEGYDFCLNYID